MTLRISEIRERLALGRARKPESYNLQAYITAKERTYEVETEKAAILILSDARGLNLIRP